MNNGQYCKSGIAFPETSTIARCTTTDHIKFNNQVIEKPYKCDPTDNSRMCELYFNVTDYRPNQPLVQKMITTTCKCALDGDNGFCGSVIGTSIYENGLAALKTMYQESTCHTLDRFNLRAQKDSCGIGPTSEWEAAVTEQFVIKYWPYINAKAETVSCINEFFSDSLQNLKKNFSVYL